MHDEPVTSPTLKCVLPAVDSFPDLHPTANATGITITNEATKSLYVWAKENQQWEDKATQCLANRGAL